MRQKHKQTLYIVTLEKIEKRYTAQWHKYWKPEFKKYFDNVEYIDGVTPSDKIEKGRFLDINQTNIWKAEQTKRLSEMFYKGLIKDNDIFLLMDGWHFGITALKYMAQLQELDIKIFTYLHAGTWDKWDFIAQAGLTNWAQHNELGWLKACDGHFVATKFHKSLIMKHFKGKIKATKISVVGFPMNWKKAFEDVEYIESLYRYDYVVFPHRLDEEKNPDYFDSLAKHFPKYAFIKTIEVTKNKAEYYKLLTAAKISFSASEQETFGIGTVEAMLLGCIPLVPNRLSYVELYSPMFRYNNKISAKQKIKWFMKEYGKSKVIERELRANRIKIMQLSKQSFKNMAMVMKQ